MADSTPAPAAPILRNPFQPVVEQSYGTGDIAAERAYQLAETQIATGKDPARVAAALAADGYDPALVDQRTPAQKSVDAEFGIEHRADPSAMFFLIPSGTVEPGSVAAFNTDLRELAVDIGLSRDAGSSFCNMIVKAIQAGNAEPDPAAAAERHATVLKNVFGDKLAEKTADILWLLSNFASDVPQKLRDGLKPTGPLGSRPEIFVTLANRAARMRLYSAARGAK